jgi:hypothetical protein
MTLLFWKCSNGGMHLLFLQKQEGSNKVIMQSSVAALFGVNFEDLKTVIVKVVLSGDFKGSSWLDESQRRKQNWCFNLLSIIDTFVSCKWTPRHPSINLDIFYHNTLLRPQEINKTSSNVPMSKLPRHETTRTLASSRMWRPVAWRILFDVSEEPFSFNSKVNDFK